MKDFRYIKWASKVLAVLLNHIPYPKYEFDIVDDET